MVTHRAETPEIVCSEGAALRIGAWPTPLLLETLLKTFISVRFELHPNKLKPQMGWSELGFKFGFHTAHMHSHACMQHSGFSDLRDRLELLLRQRSAVSLGPYITHTPMRYSHRYWGEKGEDWGEREKEGNLSSSPKISFNQTTTKTSSSPSVSLPMANRK